MVDDSVSASLRELGRRTVSHLRVFVAGALVSALGIALMAAGVQRVPPIYIVIVGIGIMLASSVLAFHDVRVKRDQFGERLEPKLEMSDDDDACYQVGDNDVQGHFQTRKIVVRNIGGTTITGLRVSLVDIRPDDEHLTQILPLPLQPQHVHATANYGLRLAPGDNIPIGVFGVNTKMPDFLLYHVADGAKNRIRGLEGDSYVIHIQAVGDNIQPITRTAKIARDEQERPTLTLLG